MHVLRHTSGVCVCVCVCAFWGERDVCTKVCCEKCVHDVKTLPIIFIEVPTFITLKLKHVTTRNSFQNCSTAIALMLLIRYCLISELMRAMKEQIRGLSNYASSHEILRVIINVVQLIFSLEAVSNFKIIT
jgi:hypothetical protein